MPKVNGKKYSYTKAGMAAAKKAASKKTATKRPPNSKTLPNNIKSGTKKPRVGTSPGAPLPPKKRPSMKLPGGGPKPKPKPAANTKPKIGSAYGPKQSGPEDAPRTNARDKRVAQKAAQEARRESERKRRNDALAKGVANRKKKKFGASNTRRVGPGDQGTPGRGRGR